MGIRRRFWQWGQCSGIRGASSCCSARRTAGSVRPVCRLFFYGLLPGRGRAQPLQGEEAVGEERQAGVVMEAPPGAALEVVQAQLLFQLLVALLHRPATLPQADRLHAAGPRRQVREGELPLAVGLLLDQQPDRPGAGAGPLLPALARPDAQPGEARRQLALAAL